MVMTMKIVFAAPAIAADVAAAMQAATNAEIRRIRPGARGEDGYRPNRRDWFDLRLTQVVPDRLKAFVEQTIE